MSGQKAITAFTFIQGQTTADVTESCSYQTSLAAALGSFLSFCFSEAVVTIFMFEKLVTIQQITANFFELAFALLTLLEISGNIKKKEYI